MWWPSRRTSGWLSWAQCWAWHSTWSSCSSCPGGGRQRLSQRRAASLLTIWHWPGGGWGTADGRKMGRRSRRKAGRTWAVRLRQFQRWCWNWWPSVRAILPIWSHSCFHGETGEAYDIWISWSLNPILHTWIGDNCFTCDGSWTIQVSPLFFKIGMVI